MSPWQVHRRELLADTLGPGRAAAHEHRHVGTQLAPEFGQHILGQIQLPQPVQRHQHGRRIGTAAAQPTAHRDALGHFDLGPGCDTRMRLQQARRDYSYIAERRFVLPGETREHADGLRELLIPG